jgi:hypothetical protein
MVISRWSRSLAAVAVAFLAVTFGFSLFIPLFIDEIDWKLLQSRLFLDGFVNISLYPQCGAAFAVQPPLIFVPVRVLDALLYADLLPFLKLRALGIATALAWIATAVWMLRRSIAAHCAWSSLVIIVAFYLGIGLLPFLLVINRPEQLLLFGLIVVLLAPFVVRPTLRAELAWTVTIVVVAIFLFAAHPKSLFFLPMIGASILLVSWRWSLRVPALGAVIYGAFVGYNYWMIRNSCPANPALAKAFATQILSPAQAVADPVSFLKQAVQSLLRFQAYLGPIRFTSTYQAAWLPPHFVAEPLAQVVNIGILMVLIGMLAALVAAIIILALKSCRERRLSRRMVMSITLLASFIALATFQNRKHFYEASLVVPLLGVAALVAVPAGLPQVGRVLTAFLVVVSLSSQALLWVSFVPVARAIAARGGYLEQQPTSFSPFEYEQIAASIREAASRCGITSKEPQRHLVVDSLTYPVFAKTTQPFNVHYIRFGGEELWSEIPGQEILETLERYGSSGLITGCHVVPSDLRARVVATGPFCCLPSFAH